METLKGKTALVTGATRGIGRAIAAMLLEEGCSVAICGRQQNAVDAAVRELSAQFSHGKVAGKAADVRKNEEVADLFRFVDREFGGLDVLINNAGVGVFRSVTELSIEEWLHVIDTNLHGVFYCTREALTRFASRGAGFIINISSLAGKNPFAGGAAYNASKFALTGFSEAAMLDVRNENIRVSYIMPGSVDTGFSAGGGGANWKIWPEDIAEVVSTVLRMPERTLISRIEIRPSRPKR